MKHLNLFLLHEYFGKGDLIATTMSIGDRQQFTVDWLLGLYMVLRPSTFQIRGSRLTMF